MTEPTPGELQATVIYCCFITLVFMAAMLVLLAVGLDELLRKIRELREAMKGRESVKPPMIGQPSPEDDL
jgi:hypothetical protein